MDSAALLMIISRVVQYDRQEEFKFRRQFIPRAKDSAAGSWQTNMKRLKKNLDALADTTCRVIDFAIAVPSTGLHNRFCRTILFVKMDNNLNNLICVKQVDPVQGFSSWHIKWPIGILASADGLMTDFSTVIENATSKGSFSWCMLFGFCGDGDLRTLLYTTCTKFVTPVAAVFRFGMSSKNKASILGDSRCRIFDNYYSDLYELPTHGFDHGNDEVVIHLWLDIPNAVLQSKFRKRKWREDDDDSESVDMGLFSAPGTEKLLSDVEHLFKGVLHKDESSASFSDVTLIAKKDGAERRFFCHRNILARSPVFQRMFANRQWKEGADKNERIVEIDDIDGATMEIVLRYIYTSCCTQIFGQCALSSAIYAADKYMLSELKEWCAADMILNSHKDSDRIEQFQLADVYHLDQLKAVCVASLSTDIAKFSSKEWREQIPDELLAEVVNMAAKRQVETISVVAKTRK